MPTKVTELKKRLRIQPGRDPLVNENPILSDEDYLEYLKEYIAEGKERWAQILTDRETKTALIAQQKEQIEVLKAQVEDASNVRVPNDDRVPNTKARAFHYFREIINGMAAAGAFDTAACGKGIQLPGKRPIIGDEYLALMFRHAAGVTEIACKETLGRF